MPKKKAETPALNNQKVAKEEQRLLTQEERQSAVQVAIANIERVFGKGSILARDAQQLVVDCIPTGSVSLDEIMGGGYTKGRMTEIYGQEGCGKTTLALHAIAETQKRGGIAALIDAEHALNTQYAATIGADISKTILSQPGCGEEGLEIANRLIRSGGIDLIVIDSVAALTPRAELEGTMDDNHVGRQARLMSQFFRVVNGAANRTKTAVILINQIRMKIGIMYGPNETTSGGNALKFYACHRLEVRKGGKLEQDGNQIGSQIKVKIVKNKIAVPYRETMLDLIYGQGFNQFSDIIRVGVSKGIIEKSGSWYSYKGCRLGQGEHGASETIRNNPELFQELRNRVLGVEHVSVRDDDITGTGGDGN